MLLTHDFPKPHKHNVLNKKVYVQYCSVEYTVNFGKNYLEIFWDWVNRKMKLEALFKDTLEISKDLKISLNVHAKSVRNVCEGM